MAQSVQISCINKQPRLNPHERISNIGGINADGSRWKMSLERAIDGVESGKWSFFTKKGLYNAKVIVATHNGHKYLKTEADGVQPDNLLALDECP